MNIVPVASEACGLDGLQQSLVAVAFQAQGLQNLFVVAESLVHGHDVVQLASSWLYLGAARVAKGVLLLQDCFPLFRVWLLALCFDQLHEHLMCQACHALPAVGRVQRQLLKPLL